MLLDITMSNFRSVKESQSVSFEAVQDRSFDKQQIVPVGKKLNVLKTAAIVGPNGSGKSSVVRALEAIQTFVLADDLNENALSGFLGAPFSFDKDWRDRPSSVAVQVITGIDQESGDPEICCYTLEADKNIVHRETLVIRVGRSTRRLFDRILQETPTTQSTAPATENGPVYKFLWGKKYLGDKKKLGKRVPANRSFLAAAAAAGGESVMPMYLWIKDGLCSIPLGLSGASETQMIQTLTRRPELKQKVLEFLWCMDLMDIRDIRISDRGQERLIYIHGAGDSRFASYFASEAPGVRRLTLLAVSFMDAFTQKKTIISDDFSLFLHPSVTAHLLRIFIQGSKDIGSQLLITGVDTTLLDNGLLRRDGIWFTTKGHGAGTIYYSLSDYKYRKKHIVSQMYVNGAFGALPILSDFSFNPDLIKEV